MPEILIYTPDGKKRYVPLESDMTLGRSTGADLCYADDVGLSRFHVRFERAGSGYLVRDMKSKNGTLVNGNRIVETHVLRPNDKLSCGHLLIVYEPPRRSSPAVVFIDEDTAQSDNATIVTSLGGVISESRRTAAGTGSQLSALIRAGNELANERPLAELFGFILDLSIDAVTAERGVLLTMEDGELVERASRGENFKISTAVRDRVLESKLSVMVRDTTLDEAYRERQSIIGGNVKTLMAVPLQARDRVIGLIYVDSPSIRREFTRDDLGLLTVMANVAAIRIEHVRLAEVEQARKLMERELEQAEAIQRGALPSCAPQVPGLDIAGHNASSRLVGGDYYDFFTGDDGRVAIMLADVSGKGMPAALMAMALQARVQPLFETLPTGPGALKSAMERLNRLTTANCPEGRFITVFACVADGKRGQLDWSCAGHNPPLVVRANGKHELLRDGGPIMGIFKEMEYPQVQSQLEPGDLLAIYSDGITEACSGMDEEFEIENLADVLAQNRKRPAAEVIEAVLQRLREWTNNAPPADDITLVIARRL